MAKKLFSLPAQPPVGYNKPAIYNTGSLDGKTTVWFFTENEESFVEVLAPYYVGQPTPDGPVKAVEIVRAQNILTPADFYGGGQQGKEDANNDDAKAFGIPCAYNSYTNKWYYRLASDGEGTTDFEEAFIDLCAQANINYSANEWCGILTTEDE